MEPSAIEPSVIQAGQLRKPIGQHQRVTVPQRVTLHLEMNQETGLSDSTGLIIIPDSFDAALESLSAYGNYCNFKDKLYYYAFSRHVCF